MISKQDVNFIERAMRVASAGTERQKHGCVVTKNGKVLAVGVNTFRNHPKNVNDPSRQASNHAEKNAGNSVPILLQGTTFYIARVHAFGHGLLSEPCGNCLSYMLYERVKRVVWTADPETIHELRLR